MPALLTVNVLPSAIASLSEPSRNTSRYLASLFNKSRTGARDFVWAKSMDCVLLLWRRENGEEMLMAMLH